MEDPGTNDIISVLRLLYTAYLTLTLFCRLLYYPLLLQLPIAHYDLAVQRREPPGKLHKDKKKTVQPSAITHFYKLAQSYPNRPLFCFSFAGAFLHRESGISDTGSEVYPMSRTT